MRFIYSIALIIIFPTLTMNHKKDDDCDNTDYRSRSAKYAADILNKFDITSEAIERNQQALDAEKIRSANFGIKVIPIEYPIKKHEKQLITTSPVKRKIVSQVCLQEEIY